MLRNSYTKWIWDSRRSLPIWTIAVAAIAALYRALWQSIDSPEMRNALHTLPQSVLDAVGYGGQLTPAGYLTAQVYGLVDAMVLLIFAISAGAKIVAGDESRGQLDIILAQPVGRIRLALERIAAVVTGIVGINIALASTLLVVARATGLDGISAGGFAAMGLHMVAFATFFAVLAFAAGAATGSRVLALSTAAGVAVVAFVCNGVLPQVRGLEWTPRLSAFSWLTDGTPLLSGVQWGHFLILLALAAVIAIAGTWAFDRRDIRS